MCELSGGGFITALRMVPTFATAHTSTQLAMVRETPVSNSGTFKLQFGKNSYRIVLYFNTF